MEKVTNNVVRFLHRTQLQPNVLAGLLQCSVDDVDAALAGAPLPDALRTNISLFRDRWERNLNAYSEGWNILLKHSDEVWHQFTDERLEHS